MNIIEAMHHLETGCKVKRKNWRRAYLILHSDSDVINMIYHSGQPSRVWLATYESIVAEDWGIAL